MCHSKHRRKFAASRVSHTKIWWIISLWFFYGMFRRQNFECSLIIWYYFNHNIITMMKWADYRVFCIVGRVTTAIAKHHNRIWCVLDPEQQNRKQIITSTRTFTALQIIFDTTEDEPFGLMFDSDESDEWTNSSMQQRPKNSDWCVLPMKVMKWPRMRNT